MAHGELYHVFEFFNDEHDSSPHYAVMGLDERSDPIKKLEILAGHNSKMKIDLKQTIKSFPNKPAAEAEKRLRESAADQLNPDRQSAEKAFPPGEANRIFDVGRPPEETPAT